MATYTQGGQQETPFTCDPALLQEGHNTHHRLSENTMDPELYTSASSWQSITLDKLQEFVQHSPHVLYRILQHMTSPEAAHLRAKLAQCMAASSQESMGDGSYSPVLYTPQPVAEGQPDVITSWSPNSMQSVDTTGAASDPQAEDSPQSLDASLVHLATHQGADTVHLKTANSQLCPQGCDNSAHLVMDQVPKRAPSPNFNGSMVSCCVQLPLMHLHSSNTISHHTKHTQFCKLCTGMDTPLPCCSCV